MRFKSNIKGKAEAATIAEQGNLLSAAEYLAKANPAELTLRNAHDVVRRMTCENKIKP